MYIPPMAVSPFDTEHMSNYARSRGLDLQTLLEAACAPTTSAIPTPGTAPEDQPAQDLPFVDETDAVQ